MLSSGYSTANKLDISTKIDLNGEVGLKTTFERVAADKVSAVLKATTKRHGVALEATADGSGTVKAKVSKANLIEGVKLTVDTSLAGGAKVSDIATPTITADYNLGDVSASTSVAGSTLDASATYTSGAICVGACATYDSASGSLGDPSVAASYSMGPTTLTGSMKGLNADDLTATVAHEVNSDLQVASTFSSQDSKFALGGSYKIDGASSIKAKVNSDGLVDVGYAYQLTPSSSLAAGLQVDTNNMDSRKFGVSMSLS